MFAHIKKYGGNPVKIWAIVERLDSHDWKLVNSVIQWGGSSEWDAEDLEDAYLEPTRPDLDTFTLFGPEDKRVPAKIVAEFMRRALLGAG